MGSWRGDRALSVEGCARVAGIIDAMRMAGRISVRDSLLLSKSRVPDDGSVVAEVHMGRSSVEFRDTSAND